MIKERILVIGASGQIGVELTLALRKMYGNANVVASDLREENDSSRYSLYQQMDRLIVEDAPVVPLWYDMALHLVHNNISGFYPNGLNMLELRKLKKITK